ncbi:hypothetical protein BJ138DRAFT_1117935 [Hygrophoropsis aurantiaca]|uniref:Uncharacterized protein n=1 Tax=Hygrophoropsis aurantiaca TaxID=72124 RepID=A0ACB7ZXS5_9AGAM|nr:hypothetical protein BJ138DRAFT_1117935 [Hygrophoropsis aurantiaca]
MSFLPADGKLPAQRRKPRRRRAALVALSSAPPISVVPDVSTMYNYPSLLPMLRPQRQGTAHHNRRPASLVAAAATQSNTQYPSAAAENDSGRSGTACRSITSPMEATMNSPPMDLPKATQESQQAP